MNMAGDATRLDQVESLAFGDAAEILAEPGEPFGGVQGSALCDAEDAVTEIAGAHGIHGRTTRAGHPESGFDPISLKQHRQAMESAPCPTPTASMVVVLAS